MAVGEQALAHGRLADLGAPALRVAEEELLIAADAAARRRLLAALGQAIGVVGRGQPGHVGDVLAHRELAVDVQIGKRLIGVELLDQRRRRRLEVREVGGVLCPVIIVIREPQR